MVSESKKRANAEWNKKNLATLGCTVRKDKAELFKELCELNGTKVNSVLKEFVESYIKENNPEK